MNEAGHNGESRREFLRGSARYALLTAVAAVSATLFQRSGGQLSGQTCINQGICRGCGAFADCGLPQALSAKQFSSPNSRGAEAQKQPGENQSRLTSAATEQKGAS
jgi:hypothetical protein